jgi:putative aldouronate transport system substrate-binding protein
MKKLTLLCLIGLLAGSMFLVGCKGKSAAAGGEKKGLLANGDVTLTMFMYGGIGQYRTSYDYADNTLTKRIVDETGINLQITSMSGADSAQRLNVMLNSGDYPDIIFGKNFSVSELTYYGAQGILLPLDKYNMAQYPNIKKILDEYPAVENLIRGGDGNTYALPQVNDCLHCLYRSGRAAFNMPFIRDNGLSMFDSYDGFVDYLRWVRDNDANHNGDKNDEIPLMWPSGSNNNAISFLARKYLPFINSSYFGLALYDGKVTEQYRLPEFREALRFMAGL